MLTVNRGGEKTGRNSPLDHSSPSCSLSNSHFTSLAPFYLSQLHLSLPYSHCFLLLLLLLLLLLVVSSRFAPQPLIPSPAPTRD
jgi:hypothetical protein